MKKKPARKRASKKSAVKPKPQKLSKQEAELLKVYDSYWDSYTKGDIKSISNLLIEDYNQVGSAETEFFINKKQAVKFLHDTIDQVAGKAELRNRIKKVDYLNNFVLISEQCDLYALSDGEWMFYSKFRASTVMQQRWGKWKIIHQHSSVPDLKALEGENLAIDKIAAENQQLREAVKRRTVELENKYRELEIEAALERVRVRAMAMHHSSELSEVAAVLFKQISLLTKTPNRFNIGIVNEKQKSFDIWLTDQKGHSVNQRFVGYSAKSPVIANMFQAWKTKKKQRIKDLYGSELRNWIKYMHGELGIPFDMKQVKDHRYINSIFFSHGFIGTTTNEPIHPEVQQLLERFAKVFDQTYTRFLDLQKAEAQAREAQIEAALERVRSKTMAMHSSQDVGNTMIVLFEELVNLGIEADRNGILIMQEHHQAELWTARPNSKSEVELLFWRLDMNLHEMPREVYKSWKNKKLNFEFKLKGKSLKAYYKILNNLPDFPGHFDLNTLPSQQWGHFFNFNEGCIYLFTSDQIPEADANILDRFASVFSQTYRRYKDLEKAEAQAREAQIEAALERVRARTMAMHDSAEFGEVAAVLFDQISLLTYAPDRFQIAIVNEEAKSFDIWVTEQGGRKLNNAFLFRTHESPVVKEVFQAWKMKKNSLVQQLSGKKLNQWIRYVEQVAGIPFDKKQIAKDRYINSLFFSHGCIGITTNEPPEPALLELIERFTKVFQQTYTRFLDLQKAEAQAREAQIEVALEKVRSRTMAMQHSDELAETAYVLFQQLVSVGVNHERINIGIINEKEAVIDFWVTEQGGKKLSASFSGSIHEPIVLSKIFEGWKSKQKSLVIDLKGRNLTGWLKYLQEEMGIPFNPSFRHERRVQSTSYFSMGVLVVTTPEPIPDEHIKLLERFANVFDLTYKRFSDLRKAEASAREAKRQASLDRVRGEIASMRSTEDLQRINPLVWQELTAMEIPFTRCGVFIMDESENLIHAYLSAPGGRSLGVLHLPFESTQFTTEAIDHWRKQEMYLTHWNQDQFVQNMKTMIEQGQIEETATYQGSDKPPESLHLHFIDFKQGMLYVGNDAPLNHDAIESVKTLANSFSVAYARYEDFKKLEAAKAQVENTLSDLKAAQSQLVQSEKMASLGELTAGIAHEIQNPLNFVNNFSEVSNELLLELKDALDKGNTEEVQALIKDVIENLNKILHHGKRADGIVKGMLQHSRASSSQKELTDINVLADEYLRLAYHGMRAKDKSFNAKFETDFDSNLPKLNVVPQDIGRVILNLITNAFYVVNERSKKEKDGYQPTVWVKTKLDGDKVMVSVKDNGTGIPESVKEKIFQPFFTTKPTGQGTGLGLSLSYDIVKAHNGGELKVETVEGEGSTFMIELPIV